MMSKVDNSDQMASNTYDLEDLKYLMQRLREPEFGCPWDAKQDFNSLIPYTLEECYEVIDTIERKDWDHLTEELGDLFFQIIFYSQLASESRLFNIDDVVHRLVEKLIRRHPHVFLDGQLKKKVLKKPTDEEIASSWQEIKRQERELKGLVKSHKRKILDDIPLSLPAMSRSTKLQNRAANVGFDWKELQPVIDKLDEELAELKDAIESGDIAHIKDEMGDLFFSQINLARHLHINPEDALRSTNQKFTKRFNHVEDQVEKSELDWHQYSLDELNDFWNDAKKQS